YRRYRECGGASANPVINPSRRRYYHAAELGPKVGRAAVERGKRRREQERANGIHTTEQPTMQRLTHSAIMRAILHPTIVLLSVQPFRWFGCRTCHQLTHHGVSMTVKNAFYAQSGGVTAVINASAAGVIETARQHPDRRS